MYRKPTNTVSFNETTPLVTQNLIQKSEVPILNIQSFDFGRSFAHIDQPNATKYVIHILLHSEVNC